jgi:hypothetical protein
MLTRSPCDLGVTSHRHEFTMPSQQTDRHECPQRAARTIGPVSPRANAVCESSGTLPAVCIGPWQRTMRVARLDGGARLLWLGTRQGALYAGLDAGGRLVSERYVVRFQRVLARVLHRTSILDATPDDTRRRASSGSTIQSNGIRRTMRELFFLSTMLTSVVSFLGRDADRESVLRCRDLLVAESDASPQV